MTSDVDDTAMPAPEPRSSFRVGLAAGLAGGALLGATVTVTSLLLLPPTTLDALRGEPQPLPAMTATPTPTPTPLPSDAWIDASTELPLDVTQPGSVVALGDPALVQLAGTNGARTLVEVTAESVSAAPEKDQRTLRTVAPVLSGQTIYYARLTAQWVAGAPLNAADVSALFSLLDANQTTIPALTLRDWDACPPAATPPSFAAATDAATWCIAAASPTEGLVAVGVRFSQAGGPYGVEQADASVRWLP